MGAILTPPELHQEAVRTHFERQAWEIISRTNFHLKGGHFDLGNNRHSSDYFNPHALLSAPALIWQLAQLMIEAAPVSAKEAEVIAGPVSGGAILAYTVAGLLDATRPFDAPPKRFVLIKEVSRELTVSATYRAGLNGATVWLLDDVIRTGSTVTNCLALMEECKANVVAVSSILERPRAVHDPSLRRKGVQRFSLAQLPEVVDYHKSACPHCMSRVPISQF